MKFSKRALLCLPVLLVFLLVACSSNKETKTPGLEEAVSTASDVYLYGYPLVTFDVARMQQTNVAVPDAEHAPMGQMIRMRMGNRDYIIPMLDGYSEVISVASPATTGYKAQAYAYPTWTGNHYNLAAWMRLTYNADGSVDMHIQTNSPPADKDANWLPTPANGTFSLLVRDY